MQPTKVCSRPGINVISEIYGNAVKSSEVQWRSRQPFWDPINYGLIRSFLPQEKAFIPSLPLSGVPVSIQTAASSSLVCPLREVSSGFLDYRSEFRCISVVSLTGSVCSMKLKGQTQAPEVCDKKKKKS